MNPFRSIFSLGVLFVILNFVLFSNALSYAESIRIASIFPRSGKAARGNEASIEGVRNAVADINGSGGVLGRKIELLEIDNKGSALGARIAAKNAVDSRAVAVIGANWSSHSLAMAPVLQSSGIPMISPFSTNPSVTRVGNYIFRVCYTDPFQGKVLANFAVHKLKADSAGLLINADSQYSEGLADFFVREFTRLGGKVVISEKYLEKKSDFSDFFVKAKQAQPDVIFLPGHTKVSAYILKQAKQSGLNIPFLGGDGWNNSMYPIAGNALDGQFYTNHWHEETPSEKNKAFVEKYRKNNVEIQPGHALAEDCVYLLVDAIRRAGSTDPSAIRDSLEKTVDFEGVTGKITFDTNGDPIKPAVILKFQHGQSEFVEIIKP